MEGLNVNVEVEPRSRQFFASHKSISVKKMWAFRNHALSVLINKFYKCAKEVNEQLPKERKVLRTLYRGRKSSVCSLVHRKADRIVILPQGTTDILLLQVLQLRDKVVVFFL